MTEIWIVLALIVLALGYLYRRQNRRAQEHQDLVDAWASLNDAFGSLMRRVQELEKAPAKRPRATSAKSPGARTGTRKARGGQRAARS